MSARSVNPGTARRPGEVQEICYQVVSARELSQSVPKASIDARLSLASSSCDFKRAPNHTIKRQI